MPLLVLAIVRRAIRLVCKRSLAPPSNEPSTRRPWMVGTKMAVVLQLVLKHFHCVQMARHRTGANGIQVLSRSALLLRSAVASGTMHKFQKEGRKRIKKKKRPSFPSINHVENIAGNCWTNLSQTELRRLGHLVVTLTLAARKP